jgi:hypothetical protein
LLTLTPAGPSARLSWISHPAAASYAIYHGDPRFDLWVLIGTSTTTVADVRLSPGFMSSFRVTAVNSLGESDPSNVVTTYYPYRDVVQGTTQHEQAIFPGTLPRQSFTVGMAGTLAAIEVLLSGSGSVSANDQIRLTVYDQTGQPLGQADLNYSGAQAFDWFMDIDGPYAFHLEYLGLAVTPGQTLGFGLELLRPIVPCVPGDPMPTCGGAPGLWCLNGDADCNPPWYAKAAGDVYPGGELTVGGVPSGDLVFRVSVM